MSFRHSLLSTLRLWASKTLAACGRRITANENWLIDPFLMLYLTRISSSRCDEAAKDIDNTHQATACPPRAIIALETFPFLAFLHLWRFPSPLGLSLDPSDRQACSYTIYRIASARVTQLARNRAESHPLSSRVAELFSAMTRNARN